jgi:hypothetical protein
MLLSSFTPSTVLWAFFNSPLPIEGMMMGGWGAIPIRDSIFRTPALEPEA